LTHFEWQSLNFKLHFLELKDAEDFLRLLFWSNHFQGFLAELEHLDEAHFLAPRLEWGEEALFQDCPSDRVDFKVF
jgi:hypothetical protein